jgi:hypothetical protein
VISLLGIFQYSTVVQNPVAACERTGTDAQARRPRLFPVGEGDDDTRTGRRLVGSDHGGNYAIRRDAC